MSKLFAPGDITPLSGATVDLYDADHPEWLFPVSTGSTDSNGEYTLSTMSNAAKNENATYQDGDPIPAGNYTLVAYKGGIGQQVVAVQTIISEFSGQIPNVKLEAIDSDVAPAVIAIVGLGKNKDGSQTWGSASKTYPKNAAIQIVFSMPMVREYLSAIEIKSTDGGTVPTGKWSLSADWLTATYYLDAGQEMTVDKTYTVKIYGDDDTGNHAKAVNVYGNPCERTAVGTFKASASDSLSPTVQWNSPTVIQMGNAIDVNQTFRVESNEILDVNGIRLVGNPSIGVKPGVIFLGRDSSTNLYVYEFVLGKPLQFDSTYLLTVTGGRDLAGHTMNNLTGSIRTKDAASTSGIDPAASTDKQYLQAEVKSVFEKWVRAMNDRNLAQFQGLMSPEFYLEYDPARGIDAATDVNRDGRWSISEFTKMFGDRAFPQWDYCGTTMTGIITQTTGTYINVFPLTETADFEFKLTATNKINSQQCSDTAPRETFYMTLQFKNGAWKIVRASSGIDTRDKPISSPDVILSELHQLTGNLIVTDAPIADGGKLDEIPDNPSTTPKKHVRAKFQWTAVQGVQSYLVIVGDLRHQGIGRAYAFPSSVTNIATDEQWDVNDGGLGTDVTSLFFQGQGGPGGPPQALGDPNDIVFYEGGRYFWEVIGLSTIKPTDVPSMSLAILLKDISHTSALRNFGVTGLYRELEILLKPGTNPTAAPVAYSELFNGYDVGTAFQVTVTMYNPNLTANGWINSWGSQYWNDTIAFDAAGMSSKVITLFKGWNWVYLCADGDWMANPPVPSLCKDFGIYTKGGKPPVIGVWEVIDDIGNTLSGDSSDFYMASSGAKKVTINGGVSDPTLETNGGLNINLFNNELFASGSLQVPVTCVAGNCTFSALVDIYKGNNWISLSGMGATNYYTSNLGVNTDTGSVWVPPISITGFTGANGPPTLKAKYPNSADWDVDPGTDFVVNVVGKFKTPGSGYYYFYSQSGSGNSGPINSSGDGSFTFPIMLYQGWNNLSIYDFNYMNWYGLNIYAANGKIVIYPKIEQVEGVLYNNAGSYTVNDCDVTISGTAMKGPLYVYWNAPGYSEQVSVQAIGAGQSGTYSFTMPVLSNNYNYIDIYDSEWKWTGLAVYTNAANCTYTAPQVTFGGVKDSGGLDLPYVPNSYQAGVSDNTVTIYGTTNRKERSITASMWTCGGNEIYTTQAASTLNGSGTYDWSISGVKVYGAGSGLYNDIYVTDGYYFGQNVSVYSLNSLALPVAPFRVMSVTASSDGLLSPAYTGCSYMQFGDGIVGVGVGNSTITINGVSDINGTGYYIDQIGSNRSFLVSGGTFSITVPLYDQWNEISIADPGQRWFDISVYSTNGIAKPKFVTITSPQHNASPVTGIQTVTAVVSDPVGAGFTPTEIQAYAYDSASGVSKSYSNNTVNCPTCSPLTYSGSNISFSHDFGANSTAFKYVEVYAYDSVRQISHLHGVYVNNQYGYGENSWKPGKNGKAGVYQNRASNLDKLKKHQYIKSKSK